MKGLTSIEIVYAFLVEVTRILWDRGLYRQNKWLIRIHEEWFDVWTIWRTHLTMKDVDRQVEKLLETSQVDEPTFTETLEGETPLGGMMELKAPWLNETDD